MSCHNNEKLITYGWVCECTEGADRTFLQIIDIKKKLGHTRSRRANLLLLCSKKSHQFDYLVATAVSPLREAARHRNFSRALLDEIGNVGYIFQISSDVGSPTYYVLTKNYNSNLASLKAIKIRQDI